MLLCFSTLSKSENEESANGPTAAAALRLACHRGGAAEGEVTRLSRSFIKGVFVLHGRRHHRSSQPASAVCAIKSSEIFQVSFPNLGVSSSWWMFTNVQDDFFLCGVPGGRLLPSPTCRWPSGVNGRSTRTGSGLLFDFSTCSRTQRGNEPRVDSRIASHLCEASWVVVGGGGDSGGDSGGGG